MINFSNKEGTGIVIADGFQTPSGDSPLRTVINTSVTFQPPMLSSGSFAEGDILIEGIEVGDNIQLFPPYDTQGIIYQGSVAAKNTLTISLISCNAKSVELQEGAWGVVVWRR